MNFTNLKSYIKELQLHGHNGQIKFAAVAFFLSQGEISIEVSVGRVKKNWTKGLFKISYHPMLYSKAQEDGYVDCVQNKPGVFNITQKTINLVAELSTEEAVVAGELKRTGALYIVNAKGAHSFDKLLKQIFSGSKKEVLIADSYVNDVIFYHILDSIPKTVAIKLIFMKADHAAKFEASSKRFKTQYPKYEVRKYKNLHDRFMIVDNVGYVLGPSIKDAASTSPALVVKLGGKETVSLTDFFKYLWKISK